MWAASDFGIAEGLLLLVLGVASLLGILLCLAVLISMTVFVEAGIFSKLLGTGFRRALVCSLVVNAASAVVSLLLWLILGPEGGWKTAIVTHHYSRVAAYMLRSILITLSVETPVLMLMLRGEELDTKEVLRAAAVANAASYGLTFVVLLFVSLPFRG